MKAKKFVSKVLGFFGIKIVAKIETVAKKLDETRIVNFAEEAVPEPRNEIKIPNDPESARRPWTFEVVWDIISDVDHICTIDGNKNVLIGPYRPHRVLTNEIHEADFPVGSPPAMAVEAIRAQGVTVITGKCKVPEQPPGILIDIESARNKVGNDFIRVFKKEHKIHVPDDDLVTNDAVVFGYIVAEFLAQFEALRSSSPTSPVASTADSLERQNGCASSVNPAQTLADPQSFVSNTESSVGNVSVIPDPIDTDQTNPQSLAPASSDNNEQPAENVSVIPDPVDINKTDPQSFAPESSDNNEQPVGNVSAISDLIDLSEDDSKVEPESPATFPFEPWVGGQSSAFGSTPELSPAEISRTCAQFHDWKCGVGLMLVHKRCIPVTKIFTLNISLLQGNFDSHDQANKEALRRGIHHRFSVEHAAAQSADIFSPVSEPLAKQAHIVHQRQPDFVIVRHGA